MDNRIGQQLGNYRLEKLLGRGGFADVYLGTHVHLKTQAALKILQMRLAETNLEAFRQEAQTIATLTHSHIVRILDFGVEEGSDTPFLVMDYAPHGSLRQRYPKGSILPPHLIVRYVKQVAAALHHAHQKKLIHRDVKPENILLDAADNALLSDFGLVLVEQSTGSQLTQEAAGTLPYMAPEQLQGKPRPASDQYSLGIIVYEWLCGERPFHGGPIELMGQHALTLPPSLCQRIPNIPLTVEAVVLKALAKDPGQRFEHIEAFALAFESVCQAELNPISSSSNLSSSLTQIHTSQNATFRREVTPGIPPQVPNRMNTPVAWPWEASTYIPTPQSIPPTNANQLTTTDPTSWPSQALTYRKTSVRPTSEASLTSISTSTPSTFLPPSFPPGIPASSTSSSPTPSTPPYSGSTLPLPIVPVSNASPGLASTTPFYNGPVPITMAATMPLPPSAGYFLPTSASVSPLAPAQSRHRLSPAVALLLILLILVLLGSGGLGAYYLATSSWPWHTQTDTAQHHTSSPNSGITPTSTLVPTSASTSTSTPMPTPTSTANPNPNTNPNPTPTPKPNPTPTPTLTPTPTPWFNPTPTPT